MSAAHTQAVLLLTAYFSKATSGEAKPLSNKEWGRFAVWLNSKKMKPEDLLKGDLDELLKGWSDKKITLARIQDLLNRGSALAIAMEKWSRAGLWVITRADADYPRILKARLGNDAPPLFFGCGNRKLLSQGGIAAVGSRKTSEADLIYSKRLGEKAAKEGMSIVSGGAKGVDEAAMLGALDAEGTAVGILANELLRATTSGRFRKHLMANNLVLISPFYPDAGFNAGNAMQRNKYIYCLSNAAIAVHSGTKGGTWEGVLENIKHAWVPVWVKPTDDREAGNATLVKKGANSLPANIDAFDLESLKSSSPQAPRDTLNDLFSQPPEVLPASNGETVETVLVEPDLPTQIATEEQAHIGEATSSQELIEKAPEDEQQAAEEGLGGVTDQHVDSGKNADIASLSLYEHFLTILADHAAKSPQTVDQLIEITQLQKTQLNAWLKQAVEEGRIDKLNRPVRYQWATDSEESNQSEMF